MKYRAAQRERPGSKVRSALPNLKAPREKPRIRSANRHPNAMQLTQYRYLLPKKRQPLAPGPRLIRPRNGFVNRHHFTLAVHAGAVCDLQMVYVMASGQAQAAEVQRNDLLASL